MDAPSLQGLSFVAGPKSGEDCRHTSGLQTQCFGPDGMRWLVPLQVCELEARYPRQVRHIGIVQSLIVTCQLQGINAYDYLVDVLQRIDRHPASQADQLTPRLWKEHFAQQRLRSQVEQLAA